MPKNELGPGTNQKIAIKRKEFKAEIGAIENKHRPESVYVKFSTWVKPNISASSAARAEQDDLISLSYDVMDRFKKTIVRSSREIAGCFDSNFFYADTIIIDFGLAEGTPKLGKRSFLEIEINIDTVNDIDAAGNPIADRSGKMRKLHFREFVGPLTDAVNKILNMQAFKSGEVSFALTKGQ